MKQHLTTRAETTTMYEKPLTKLSCWDMPPTNSNKSETKNKD